MTESSPHMLPDARQWERETSFTTFPEKFHGLLLPLTEVPIWEPITKVTKKKQDMLMGLSLGKLQP